MESTHSVHASSDRWGLAPPHMAEERQNSPQGTSLRHPRWPPGLWDMHATQGGLHMACESHRDPQWPSAWTHRPRPDTSGTQRGHSSPQREGVAVGSQCDEQGSSAVVVSTRIVISAMCNIILCVFVCGGWGGGCVDGWMGWMDVDGCGWMGDGWEMSVATAVKL